MKPNLVLSPLIVLLVLLGTVFPSTLSFVPSSRPFRISQSSSTTITNTQQLQPVQEVRTNRPPLESYSYHHRPATSALFALVADEKEELHKKKKGDNDDSASSSTGSSWTETDDGFFLPNWSQFQQKRQLQQQEITKTKKNQLITEVMTIQDYKREVVDERERIVCVRFYAPWCRACKAVAPLYRKLAADHAKTNALVKFVEVPLTQDNAFLHEGLGVPSLPYGHIYHPQGGLVEERRMNKKVFQEFIDVLQTYVDGECPIQWEENEEDVVA